MILGVISAGLIFGAGIACLRVLGVRCGELGLAPVAGLALLAVLTTWGLLLHIPETVVGLVIVALGVTGMVLAMRGWIGRRANWRCLWLEIGVMFTALVVCVLVLLQAVSIQAGIPDYVHDGAFHAEMIDALRKGTPDARYAWYPSGFHAPAAALLALVPGLDAASGAVGWAAGITLLAPLAMYGFTRAVWHDVRVAAASALVLALTYNFPYEPHLYSVWPEAAGLLLLLGLWTVTLEYLARPNGRLAGLAGMLAAGLLLTHGTELYTAAIVLLAFAAACWRSFASWRVARHVALAAAAAVVLALPYAPALAGWTSAGGAVAVGIEYFEVRHGGFLLDDPIQEALFWSSGFSSGLLFDAPVRLALVIFGAWVALRRQHGVLLVTLTALFVALVAVFRYVDAPLMRQVFALTLPWGVDGRLLMTVPLLATPLVGLGVVCIGETLVSLARRQSEDGAAGRDRRGRRFARAGLVVGLAFLPLSVFLVAQKFVLQTNGIVTYTPDDMAAFAWLRQHSQPGDMMLNDGAADAGIWAPYKANVSIVLPRSRSVAPDGPEVLVRDHLNELEGRGDVRAAVCQLHIRYVYRGAKGSPSELRQFPSLDELRANPALEEVFSRGGAAIFRPRLNCP